MELHFLQTTWSDIIILKDGNNVAMIDTGYDGQYVEIRDYLNKMKVYKIDFILLTHFHRDHYGAIPEIIKNFEVEKVYFKEYSKLDITTAWGTLADEEYRNNEFKKYKYIKKLISTYSNLIMVENVNEIYFGKYILKLYNQANSIKEIYEDDKYKETYHKITYGENQNSLGVFFKVNGKNIFLGGDILDKSSTHPLANHVNYQIAKKINETIDIYKVPHHGTIHCNTFETLNIYRPKIVVITNSDKYLKKDSTIYEDLKNVNKDVTILLTEKNHVFINIDKNGNINYKEIACQKI